MSQDALIEALTTSTHALTAWLHQYAPDCCENEAVETHLNAIAAGGGTLAYIAKQLHKNRAALNAA